jgi:metal-responsive CopG/Arc/MetJ family transcriptional regulator
MKTAISLPDDLFAAAEELATELGVSRSSLYARAVAELVAHHERSEVTARLDAVYGAASSTLDPVVEELQARSVAADAW